MHTACRLLEPESLLDFKIVRVSSSGVSKVYAYGTVISDRHDGHYLCEQPDLRNVVRLLNGFSRIGSGGCLRLKNGDLARHNSFFVVCRLGLRCHDMRLPIQHKERGGSQKRVEAYDDQLPASVLVIVVAFFSTARIYCIAKVLT